MRFRRVFIYAPEVDRRLLESAARFAALVPAADLHVVASTVPAVLETLPAAVSDTFGRQAGRVRIQLVPEPSAKAFYRLARSEEADLIVVPTGLVGPGAIGAPCSTMSLPASSFADHGKGVVALVNWEGGAATLATAIDMARRMRQPRVTACHVYFNEAAIVSDEWEAREAGRRQRRLDLLVARAAGGDVQVATRIVQCPDIARAMTRPEMPAADLVVSSEPVVLDLPVLTVRCEASPDTVLSRRRAWPLLGPEIKSEPA